MNNNFFINKIYIRLGRIIKGKIYSKIRYIAFGYQLNFNYIRLLIAVDGKISNLEIQLFDYVSSELQKKMKVKKVDYYIERADFPNQVSDNFKFENKLPFYNKYEENYEKS